MSKTEAHRRPLRVCYFGTHRANYARNEVMVSGLRQHGVEGEECHSTLWHSVADRLQQASGGWRQPRFWVRLLGAFWRLWRAYRQAGDYDVMLVDSPGQFDVYPGRLFSWWRRPKALDISIALHLIATERGLTIKSPFTGKLIFWLKKRGLPLPDLLFVDTSEYEQIVQDKYQLQDQPRIQFDLYGEGQEPPAAEWLAQELGLSNLHYLVARQSPQALADGIWALAADPQLRQQIVEHAYARVQANTVAATVQRVKDAFLSCLPVFKQTEIA